MQNLRERLEKSMTDMIEDVIDQLEHIYFHCKSGDYSLEEIQEEIGDLLEAL